jgi:hypothetical protein
MQFFRKPTIGGFDIACARFAIDTENLIGITHPQATPRSRF